MAFKRICSAVLAAFVAGTSLTAAASEEAERSAGSSEVCVLAAFGSEADINAVLTDRAPASSVEDNGRMFSRTMKVTAAENEAQSYICNRKFSVDFGSDEYKDYEYINFWIYSPEPSPVDSDGNPSTMDILLRTRKSSNTNAFYYSIPLDWTGWRQVSVSRSDFINRNSGSWTDTPLITEFWILTNTESNSIPKNTVKWPADGSGYYMLDYVYLSKELPPDSLHVLDMTVENGAAEVLPDLDGRNTFSLIMTNGLLKNSVHEDKVKVTKNGDVIGGYSVSVDENDNHKLSVIFGEALDLGAEYSISFEPKCIYDEYGFTIPEPVETVFTVSEHSAEVTPDADTVELFSMDSPDAINNLIKSTGLISSTDKNTRMYDNTLYFDIPADRADRTLKCPCDGIDVSVYQYANYWIYSPEANSYGLNLIFYTSDAGNSYFRYTITVNWTGWKLISLPLAGFAASGSPVWEHVKEFRINANGWVGYAAPWTDGGHILLDQVYLSKTMPGDFSYAGSSLPQNFSTAPTKDMELLFSYTNTLSPVRSDAVTVTKSGTDETVPFEISVDGKTLKLYFSDLEPDTQYNAELSGQIYDSAGQQTDSEVQYSFKTAAEGLSVGKPVFDSDLLPSAGGQVNISVQVKNNEDVGRSAALVAAQYDINGAMLDLTEAKQSFEAGEGDTLNAGIEIKDGTIAIRAFVCDENRNLLRYDYSVLGEESPVKQKVYSGTAAAASGISVDSTELNTNELSIKGTYGGVGAVLLQIKASDGAEILAVPVYADSENEFSYKYIFGDDMQSGMYSINAIAVGARADTAVLYQAEQKRIFILNGVNSADSAEEINELLSENKLGLGIDGVSAKRVAGISQTLFEQRPFAEFSDLIAMISTSQSLLDTLNNTIWSGMSAFLDKNHDIVLYQNADYNYYAGLSDKKRNIINVEAEKSLPADSFTEFRAAFSSAVESCKSGPGTTGGTATGGGAGGGGGGKKGVSISFGNDLAGINNNVSEAANSGDIFADLEKCLWAKESIERLYELGVIALSVDNKFRPDDSVTREEFIKMLVAAFGQEIINKDSGFTDAEAGAWYQPYLTAAREAGITEGKPDGSFGIGEPITRQDMAVMAYRAVSALNKTLKREAEQIIFSDYKDISGYALNAVTAMQTAGVLNGMGDGSFMPLAQSSRAQAARVIYGLLEATEQERGRDN